MNTQEIKEFVLKASKATYASGDQSIKVIESDKSTSINFSDGEFRFHDNYFGGEPYGGREVVFYNQKPVWMMTYYGYVLEKNPDQVYEILMSALRLSTIDMPYRGPSIYEKDEWKYVNEVQGEFENFFGIEKIYKSETLVYQARYMGGLVDK